MTSSAQTVDYFRPILAASAPRRAIEIRDGDATLYLFAASDHAPPAFRVQADQPANNAEMFADCNALLQALAPFANSTVVTITMGPTDGGEYPVTLTDISESATGPLVFGVGDHDGQQQRQPCADARGAARMTGDEIIAALRAIPGFRTGLTLDLTGNGIEIMGTALGAGPGFSVTAPTFEEALAKAQAAAE